MIGLIIVLITFTLIDGKMNHPKKPIGLIRKSISILQLIEEPLIVQESQNKFEKERLEFDSNLLLQQELIEESVSEFPKANYTIPKFNQAKQEKQLTYKQEFLKVKSLLIKLHHKEVLLCIFAVSVFSAFIWCIIKLCLLFRPQRHYEQEEEEKLLGADYSILNSKTISDDQNNQTAEIKYKITDMTPQIRNPYDESFVKASMKATTRCSAGDQSLLEIDELLQELK